MVRFIYLKIVPAQLATIANPEEIDTRPGLDKFGVTKLLQKLNSNQLKLR